MIKPMDKRLKREHDTVLKMIRLYCRGQHANADGPLCAECQELADYAAQRIEGCPFGADKPTCANCSVHCYRPEMRQRIRQVMRYAGPHMLFHHPFLTLMHLIDGLHNPENR